MIIGDRRKTVVLYDVYYVPNIRRNLMSVSQIERKGKELLIKDGQIKIRNMKIKQTVCIAYRSNDLYVVRAEVNRVGSIPVESHTMSMEKDLI